VISGAKAKGRDFVYWTEVKNIPSTDLATIERLWQQFSGGKFGYSVQKVSKGVLIGACVGSNIHNQNDPSSTFYNDVIIIHDVCMLHV
jgi:GUN4-like.